MIKNNYLFFFCAIIVIVVVINMDKNKIKEAAFAYFKSTQELKEERKHKFLYVLTIILFILIVIKITVGEIVIPIPLEYNDNRLYEVYVNEKVATVEVGDERKITIIPYFLSFVQYHNDVYIGDLDIYEDIVDSPYYKLKINSYICYAEMPSLKENKKINYKVSCNTEQDYIKEKTSDTTYQLHIKRTHRGKEVILYDGKFIQDITPYIKEKGRYLLTIIGKYNNVESKIYVSFDKE